MPLSREKDRARARRRRADSTFRAKENERRTAAEFLKDANARLAAAPANELSVARPRHFAALGAEHSNPIRLHDEFAGVEIQKYGGNRSSGHAKAVFKSWRGEDASDQPRQSAMGQMLNKKLDDAAREGEWFLDSLRELCSELTRAFITHAIADGRDRRFMRYPVEWDWNEWWRGSKATWKLGFSIDVAPTFQLEDEVERIAQRIREIEARHPSLAVPAELQRLKTRAEKQEQLGQELERIATLHQKYSALSLLTREVGCELTPTGPTFRLAPEATVAAIAKMSDASRRRRIIELMTPVNLWATYVIGGGVLNGHLLFRISPLLVDPASKLAGFPILMYIRPADKLPLPSAEALGSAALTLLVDGTTASY